METIKTEVTWTFQKHLSIKVLIKTCNGKNGQNSLQDIATNYSIQNMRELFFSHSWIENSSLKFYFNCKELFLFSRQTWTFKEGWPEKALCKQLKWDSPCSGALCWPLSSPSPAAWKCPMWSRLYPRCPSGCPPSLFPTGWQNCYRWPGLASPFGGRNLICQHGKQAPTLGSGLTWEIIESRRQMDLHWETPVPRQDSHGQISWCSMGWRFYSVCTSILHQEWAQEWAKLGGCWDDWLPPSPEQRCTRSRCGHGACPAPLGHMESPPAPFPCASWPPAPSQSPLLVLTSHSAAHSLRCLVCACLRLYFGIILGEKSCITFPGSRRERNLLPVRPCAPCILKKCCLGHQGGCKCTDSLPTACQNPFTFLLIMPVSTCRVGGTFSYCPWQNWCMGFKVTQWSIGTGILAQLSGSPCLPFRPPQSPAGLTLPLASCSILSHQDSCFRIPAPMSHLYLGTWLQ